MISFPIATLYLIKRDAVPCEYRLTRATAFLRARILRNRFPDAKWTVKKATGQLVCEEVKNGK